MDGKIAVGKVFLPDELLRCETLRKTREEGNMCFDSHLNISTLVINRVTDR